MPPPAPPLPPRACYGREPFLFVRLDVFGRRVSSSLVIVLPSFDSKAVGKRAIRARGIEIKKRRSWRDEGAGEPQEREGRVLDVGS